MKQDFGLSWQHGKQKLIAAVALLAIAIALAVAPAASSFDAAKGAKSTPPGQVEITTYSILGSTWG